MNETCGASAAAVPSAGHIASTAQTNIGAAFIDLSSALLRDCNAATYSGSGRARVKGKSLLLPGMARRFRSATDADWRSRKTVRESNVGFRHVLPPERERVRPLRDPSPRREQKVRSSESATPGAGGLPSREASPWWSATPTCAPAAPIATCSRAGKPSDRVLGQVRRDRAPYTPRLHAELRAHAGGGGGDGVVRGARWLDHAGVV